MKTVIGKWKVLRLLGVGGNGEVYEVTDGKNKFALKTLKKFAETKPYGRFRDEITALLKLGSVSGIIKIIDHNIPDKPKANDLPYYIMPVAESLEDFLKNKSHKVLFESFLKISYALHELHNLEYTHRDIKPNNMLVVNGEPVLSDFGLVSFPDKSTKSKLDENIGARWTIAPEMQRDSSKADFKKADVYSLAKTLWILITGRTFGFEGQYIPKSAISIDNFIDMKVNKPVLFGEWYYFSIVLLEKLLVKATDNNPTIRPTSYEFFKELEFWYNSNNNFQERNIHEWAAAINYIFPFGLPFNCEWNQSDEIYKVLSLLTQYDNLNYCFYPDMGGNDLTKVSVSEDNRYLILNDYYYILPEKLIFYSFGDEEWSYFRIVSKELTPISNTESKHREFLILNEEGNFKVSNPDDDRSIARYFKGSFIIVRKTSFFNKVKSSHKGYDLNGHHGLHEEVTYEKYNEVWKEVREIVISQKS